MAILKKTDIKGWAGYNMQVEHAILASLRTENRVTKTQHSYSLMVQDGTIKCLKMVILCLEDELNLLYN